MDALICGRDPDDLFAFEVPRKLKIRDRKLGILRLLLGVALITYIVYQIIEGTSLYEQVQVSEWGSGSITVAPDFAQHHKWKAPLYNHSLWMECPPMSRDVLAGVVKRHIERLGRWVNDHGFVQMTDPYMRDWCENHQLAHLQYGSKIRGVMVSAGPAAMLSILEVGGFEHDTYTAFVEEEEATEDSGFHLGQWWGHPAYGFMALGMFKEANGKTMMVLQTGQTLDCAISGNNVTVITRKGKTVTGVLAGRQINWSPNDPFGSKTRKFWVYTPPLVEKSLAKDQILQQAPSVKALGIPKWSPNALQTVADEAMKGSTFTVVFDTPHATPCLTRHAQRLVKQQSPDDILLILREEHHVHVKDFLPVQLADGEENDQESHIMMGSTMHANAASAVVQLSFTAINKNAVEALENGTIASCSVNRGTCENETDQRVSDREWDGFKQKSVMINVSDLLVMKDVDLKKCSSSDACTLQLVVRFSNDLGRFNPVNAFRRMVAPIWRRLGQGELVPESESEWGRIKFRVEVYETVSSGQVNDFSLVRSKQKECTHERKHLGVRMQMRIAGTLYRFNAMQALQALGSYAGLVAIVNTVVTMCAIGFLGRKYVGPVAMLYKAMTVKHTPDASTMEDRLRERYGDVERGIEMMALGEVGRQMTIGELQLSRNDKEAAMLLEVPDGSKNDAEDTHDGSSSDTSGGL